MKVRRTLNYNTFRSIFDRQISVFMEDLFRSSGLEKAHRLFTSRFGLEGYSHWDPSSLKFSLGSRFESKEWGLYSVGFKVYGLGSVLSFVGRDYRSSGESYPIRKLLEKVEEIFHNLPPDEQDKVFDIVRSQGSSRLYLLSEYSPGEQWDWTREIYRACGDILFRSKGKDRRPRRYVLLNRKQITSWSSRLEELLLSWVGNPLTVLDWWYLWFVLSYLGYLLYAYPDSLAEVHIEVSHILNGLDKWIYHESYDFGFGAKEFAILGFYPARGPVGFLLDFVVEEMWEDNPEAFGGKCWLRLKHRKGNIVLTGLSSYCTSLHFSLS